MLLGIACGPGRSSFSEVAAKFSRPAVVFSILAIFGNYGDFGNPSNSPPVAELEWQSVPCLAYRFGLFELDALTLELRRQGAIMHLQAQPLQVLASLVKSAGHVVTRDELRKAVWGDGTFVDFERGLNFCISQVRSALGDDAAHPTYIRTVARQGYQFIAPVMRVEADAPPAAPSSIERSIQGSTQSAVWGPVRSLARFRRPIAAIAAVALLAVVVFAYAAHRMRGSTHEPIVAVVRFDNETGDPGMALLSDQLTDNLVERLTSLSNAQYRVIGNAHVLRTSRQDRDLNAIASTLRADFVVLGQVQSYGNKTRILVHLIHMPEQTHVSVARFDRDVTNPLQLQFQFEDEVAQQVAGKFSSRLAPNRSNSPQLVSH